MARMDLEEFEVGGRSMERLAFRIWDPENKTFHHSGSTPTMLAGYFNKTKLLVTVHNMKHEQFIGISDDNRLDIYDGDIVRCWSGRPEDYLDFRELEGTVEYGKPYYGVRKTGDILNHLAWNAEFIEVIGNIHENT